MIEMQKDLRLIRTYYKDDQLESCKDDNLDCIEIINTNDSIYPLSKDLNKYWSEYMLMKYIWQEGKKTEYIGFDQYSKQFKKSDIDKDFNILCYKSILFRMHNVQIQYMRVHNRKDFENVLDILNSKYGQDNAYVEYLKTGKIFYNTSCFICNWEIFDEICQFVFYVLDQLDTQYNLSYDKDKYDAYIKESITHKEYYKTNRTYEYNCRVFGFLAERLLSAYLYVNYNDSIQIVNKENWN